MKREEIASVIVLAILLLVAGFTWLFGPFGLIGCGAVLLIASFFLTIEE